MAPQQQPGTAGRQRFEAVVVAMRASDYVTAASLADAAIAAGDRHAVFYGARGLALQQQGLHREALTEFNQARALAPGDANLANAIGVCLLNLNQPMDAIRAFEQAIALDPSNAQPYFRKGWTLEMLDDRDEARRFYARAIELDPNHAAAIASLASLSAAAGDIEETRALAERALKIDPSQATAIAALAIVDLEKRDFITAEHRLLSVIDRPELTLRARAVLNGYLGDALDGQGRYAEAFACYRFEKNEKRQLYAQSYLAGTRPREVLNEIAAFVRTAPAETWTPASSPASSSQGLPREHVFLLGFWRSGATLLEQVLASHPDIVATDGQDLLADAAQDLLSGTAALRKLAVLSDAECQALRDDYWRRIRARGAAFGGKVFVDALPAHTMKLPLIAKLFPQAKIVFAMRDPRDVLLSCYRSHFPINTATFELLTLDDAAEFYDAVMGLAAACRDGLPLSVHTHRYEDMAEDFDGRIAALCGFLGVEWTPAMRDAQAGRAAAARSPDGIGDWRHYREQLEGILPMLRPWVAAFGYEADRP